MGRWKTLQGEAAADVAACGGAKGMEPTTSRRGSMHVTRQGKMHAAAAGKKGISEGTSFQALHCAASLLPFDLVYLGME